MNFLSNNEPSRHARLTGKEEDPIRDIFYQHWKKVETQMKTVAAEIRQWRSQSIKEIERYANEQLHILQTRYNRQRNTFEQQRAENLNLAKTYNETKKSDLFQELSNACKSLQFQLAQLEYVEDHNNNVRPRVINQEQPPLRKSPENTSAHAREYETMNQLSPKTLFSIVNDSSRDNNKTDSQASSEIHSDRCNECPICCMTFPLNMVSKDRKQHIDNHYKSN